MLVSTLISISLLTGVPLPELQAVCQYSQQQPPTQAQWAGTLNPNQTNPHPATIAYYGGLGRDGDGDGVADVRNPVDLAVGWAEYLKTFEQDGSSFDQAVWHFYQEDRRTRRITQYEKLYAKKPFVDATASVFPLPARTHYTYKGTWGAPRGYGGRRTHEGTDLFADYGLPVRSVRYGIVEVMGWNRMGGWRVGVRDLNNNYHYFAHLSSFNKRLQVGTLVDPGTVLGWVGSSGYGTRPGTSGKFPPHLHYGLYRDNGYVDWSMDPYPFLRRWELTERRSPTKSSL
jgi:murein DD-endopeptidase MepM/ murein hydrolase activator NlpD